MNTTTLPLGAIVRTKTQQVGRVVAHNPNDRGRVLVSVWSGWCWLQPKAMDVGALTVLTVKTVQAEAA